jgi:cytochrome b561
MNAKHSAITRIIHWLTALLAIAAFVLGPEDLDEMDNPGLDWGVQIHETLGIVVIGLTVLRIIWMLFCKKPEEIPMSRAMQIASKSVQGLLYLLLLVVPATAVLGIWLEGDSLALIQNIAVAPPFSVNGNLGEFLIDIHPTLADALIWLAGFHAAAALFHHYVLKDDVLRSMLPK